MNHDDEWLARVAEHEATQSLGVSHAATTYGLSRVARAYHEHMMGSIFGIIDKRIEQLTNINEGYAAAQIAHLKSDILE